MFYGKTPSYFLREIFLTFHLHIKKVITQIVCNHLVATGPLVEKSILGEEIQITIETTFVGLKLFYHFSALNSLSDVGGKCSSKITHVRPLIE